jgi:hypothetical protein
MADKAQTYKNHARFFPLYHFFVMPVLLLNFVNQARYLYRVPSEGTAFAVVVALALVMLGLSARIMANTVQDRVIRLEMRLRLHEILPADLKARVNDLTRQQLVALRFADDAEMAGLMREVLAGSLTSQKAIKEKVKNWQGDFLRC